MSAPPSPIACRMDALTPAERARRAEVLAALTSRTLGVVDTTEGMAFELRGDPETLALAGEFVGYESRCCPFLGFQLTVEAEGGPVRLALGGREGVGDFLRAMFPVGRATRSGTS